jgi:hypothetical protein
MNLPSHNKITGQVEMREWSVPGRYFLLGLVHGHWEILTKDKNEIDPRPTHRDQEDAVNMGIAVVIPARKILVQRQALILG